MIRPPVLCYHRIGGPLELGVTRVARSVFARQMTALARAGWRTVSLVEYVQAESRFLFPLSRLSRPSSAGKEFLLTFDDGHATLAQTAYPVLAGLGFTATTFLITDFIGGLNTWDVRYTWRRLAHLDWATIEAWRERGLEFASHTATHRRLTWLAPDDRAEELGRSRDTLVARLGPSAGLAIAYPFGACDARTVELARAAGYVLGFGGAWEAAADPLRLPRVPVYMWDVWSTPFGLRSDALGSTGRFLARTANRCAVGTSVMLALTGRLDRGPVGG